VTTPTLGLVIVTRPLTPDPEAIGPQVGTGKPPRPLPEVVAMVVAVIRVPA
jgi:hypothetical protein